MQPADSRTKPRRPPKARSRTAKAFVRQALAHPGWVRALVLTAEIAGLAIGALILIMATLGRTAERFSGTGLFSSLLPFAAVVLGLALLTALALGAWWRCRNWLASLRSFLPALGAVLLALSAGWFASQDWFDAALQQFRALVGGTEQAERTAIAHQVFASYRRTDLGQFQKMLDRAQPFLPVIRDAAAAYKVDEDVLVGLGAAESSYLPRDSKDGGRGLFQITAPPKAAVERARDDLDVSRLDLRNDRHNAFVAAATLSHYLNEMRGDLFLGLLAYNIGPRNGGLLSIMSQYGARDFVTIQPYLQNLPRDYPIRVLTGALAYRLWRIEGRLPRYEEGRNARRIQGLGIPGLEPEGSSPAPLTSSREAGRAG
ncbi:MAG: transglycosylase SLT domain-containing protein [Methylotetracoccus sp.]